MNEEIKKRVAQGAKIINVNTRNAKVGLKDPITGKFSINFTCKDEIPAMVENKEVPGTFIKGTSKTVFSSNFELRPLFLEDFHLAGIVNYLDNNPSIYEQILPQCSIDVFVEEVHESQNYVDPYNLNNTSVVKHDTFYTKVIGIKLHPEAMQEIKEIKKEMRTISNS